MKVDCSVLSLAYSSDGRMLAIGGDIENNRSFLRVRDMETGQETCYADPHTGGVNAVVFSQDDRTVASASWDGLVKLWDVESGEHRITLDDAGVPRFALDFSYDGTRLVAGGGFARTIHTWRAATEDEVRQAGWYEEENVSRR